MGDYTRTNVKIGTCGKAYYATYKMIQDQFQHEGTGGDLGYYYNSDRNDGLSYAFPFPKYDGKKIGEISQFHKGDKVEFIVYLDSKDTSDCRHNQINQHIKDVNGNGPTVHVSCDCPQKQSSGVVRYYMEYTSFISGKPSILLYCAYCNQGTHWLLDEDGENEITRAIKKEVNALELDIKRLDNKIDISELTKDSKEYLELVKLVDYQKEILKRVYAWYNIDTKQAKPTKKSKEEKVCASYMIGYRLYYSEVTKKGAFYYDGETKMTKSRGYRCIEEIPEITQSMIDSMVSDSYYY